MLFLVDHRLPRVAQLPAVAIIHIVATVLQVSSVDGSSGKGHSGGSLLHSYAVTVSDIHINSHVKAHTTVPQQISYTHAYLLQARSPQQ